MLNKLSLWFVLVFFPGILYSQGNSCNSATQICSGQAFSFSAITGQANSQALECLSTTKNRSWFFFKVTNNGDIHITITANPPKDIDFLCWGAFDSVVEGCNTGLTTANKIDCSYAGGTGPEYVDVPAGIAGKYYIILVSNFSNEPCEVTLNQTSGSGSMNCMAPPAITNNGPVCSGQDLQLNATFVSGATYHWTGPNGFVSNLQNPVITNATTANSGVYSVYLSSGSITTNSVTMNVLINQSPLTGMITDTSVCSGASIQLGGAAQAGNSYSWSSVPAGFASSISNPSPVPLETTTYTVSVQNTNGCSNTGSVTITVNPLPVANAGSVTNVCSGNSIVLGGPPTSGCFYSWGSDPVGFSSSLPNPVVYPYNSTTYTLTVTSPNFCQSTANISVTILPGPAAYTGPSQSLCIGSQMVIGAAANPGFNYSWTSIPSGFTSSVANPTVNPTVTTTYILNETNFVNGCSATNSVTISIVPIPLALVAGNSTICSNTAVSIGTAANSGNNYSWTSNPPGFTSTAGNPAVSPTVTTTYTLTESVSSTGCSNSNSVVITVNPLPPTVTGPNQSICFGNPAIIGGQSMSGSVYAWTSSPSGYTSSASNPIVYPAVTITYILTETISLTGCTKSNSIVVTVNQLPFANIIANTTICSGNSVSLGGPPVTGNSYLWTSAPSGFTSNISNPSVSPTITTTYQLTETYNSNGCSKTKTAVITVNPLPTINAGTNTSVCSGSSVTLGSVPQNGINYSWSSIPTGFTSSSANPIVYPTVTTTYIVNATNGITGCTKSGSVTITVFPFLPVTFASIPTTCKDAPPFVLTGGLPVGGTYSGPGVIFGLFNPGALIAGTYNLTYQYINPSGCTGSANQVITLVNKPKITGHITYDNTLVSDIDSCSVKLLTSGLPTDSVWNDNMGFYSFQCLSSGTYQNEFNCIKKWGGVNATDALIAAQFSIGLTNLSPFRQLAGDVNISGYINATDSYMIIRRFIHVINSFPCGDWIRESTGNLVLTNQTINSNLKTICAGDVNGSYLPPDIVFKGDPGNNTSPRLIADNKQITHSNGKLVIPVSTKNNLKTSAISIVLTFDTTQIEVSGIQSDLRNIQFYTDGNQIRVAWYDLSPSVFHANEEILRIIASRRTSTDISERISFSLESETEFADEEANPITDVILQVPLLYNPKESKCNTNKSTPIIQTISPNPSSGITEVLLRFPGEGKCEVFLYDPSGRLIKSEIMDVYSENTLKFNLDLTSDSPGIYLFVVRFSNKEESFSENRKIFLVY